MATGAERVAKHRVNSGTKRLELVLPDNTCQRYRTAAAQAISVGLVTGNAQFLELLLDTYDKAQQLTGKAYAVQLLAANDGNIAASRSQLIRELQERYSSEWHPDCSVHKLGTPHYAAQRSYNGVVKHLR